MDHTEAVRLRLAEKYVLGELTGEVREAYEAHYFDCVECAADLKAAAIFVDASRTALQEERNQGHVKSEVIVPSGWFGWLRPMVVVPVFAVLIALIAYQNMVTIPAARKEGQHGSMQLIAPAISLQMANVRGEGGVTVQTHANAPFELDFDFTPARQFPSYVCQLQDDSGHSVYQVEIPGEKTNQEVHVAVSGGVPHPGKYMLAITGRTTAGSSVVEENRVETLTFSVEFLP
jgi:Putative zinc-finger